MLVLFAGIGGWCEKLDLSGWDVVSIENDPAIAECYADRYPNHTVIVGDAMAYLRDNWKTYQGKENIIQASPPCQTHSRLRYQLGVRNKKNSKAKEHEFIDPMLIQLLIFMMTLPSNNPPTWIIENVNPYYDRFVRFAPLFLRKIGRHYVWTNADIPLLIPPPPKSNKISPNRGIKNIDYYSIKRVKDDTGFDLSNWPKIKNKRQVLRNMFEPELSEYLFNLITKGLKK
ncbi:MAG: DNA cytosine methyltransferase [Rickettsiales bacterium]|nr:DNA cytosine methyltransferase [Rickettsiales bacterium]